MKANIILGIFATLVAIVCLVSVPNISKSGALTPMEELGKLLMFDQKLSVRNNQSCATCHAPIAGWTGPVPGINLLGSVYPGSVKREFGNRKPPTAAYATPSPLFDYDLGEGLFFGGNFWDGRATGWELNSPAAEQARGPFLNPVEQALPDKAAVVNRVCSSKYADLFKDVWGSGACDNVNVAYNYIALSIAAFENSSEVNQFSSKFDYYLKGEAVLTEEEQAGLVLFGENGKGQCGLCHIIGDTPAESLFTDYTFDNLGTPKNPLNPFYDTDPNFVDKGLGDFLRTLAANDSWKSLPFVTDNVEAMSSVELLNHALANDGKHKVPTLRNVDKRPTSQFVKAYGHNGFFKSLEEIVHFYNTRDVDSSWPPPEVAANVNDAELGDLGLTFEEDRVCKKFDGTDNKVTVPEQTPPCDEELIVIFMKTLSDGYEPR